MSYLKFNKEELVNLEYSLKREVLSTNRAGGYSSTTVVCCNTRKYHGLLVLPISEFGGENHVLLSSLDETIVQHGQSFNLGIHKYPGVYEPRGHKYIVDLAYDPLFSLTYRVGGVVLKKEILMVHNEAQLMIRYTLEDAHSETLLRLKPFLAYRNVHALSKANMMANTKFDHVENGIRSKLYVGFPALNMQLSKENEFVPVPDWYYNIEYLEEKNRGYDYEEDLFVPGYFEVPIKKGESIIFSASTEEVKTSALKRKFQQMENKRERRDDFESCLTYSASQFIVHEGKDTEVVAGYPWFGRWGRDTFIALPGVTLSQGDIRSCTEVLDTLTGQLQEGLFPNMGTAYNSADAPLWFFWVLQQLAARTSAREVWERYGHYMKEILAAYRKGIGEVVRTDRNGLVRASHPSLAMTWMDAVVDGRPVTGRDGYQVEINALWYNAVCYTLELAEQFGDRQFVEAWHDIPALVRDSFLTMFWYDDGGYLADYVAADGTQNTFIRPNQVLACSLAYKMPDEAMQLSVLDTVRQHLLTSRGLRTLSPRNPLYKGRYEGDQPTRDAAYHQGTVWVWPLEHYVKARFDMRGAAFVREAEELLAAFEEDISSYGIGSVPEIYDGDPPHAQRGAISQAWSVGALLRIRDMIDYWKERE